MAFKATNAWLIVNRPHYPTEPCRTCSRPVVQYRTRRYDGEMRYCQRSCQPRNKPPLAKAQWPPIRVGECSRIPKGCRECLTGLRLGLCHTHRNRKQVLLAMLSVRLRWLLPRSCRECNAVFNAWSSGWLCHTCRKRNAAASGRWQKIKRKHNMVDGDRGISPWKLYVRDGTICHICERMTDHPAVWKGWQSHHSWMPNAPTVDHIVPLAKGGSHVWDNVALAHWSCNSYKSDGIVTRAPVILDDVPAIVPSDEFVYLLYGVEPA